MAKKQKVPVQHPAHPQHSKWADAVKALELAIGIAPAVVQIFDPQDAALANQAATLAGAVVGAGKAKQ